VNGFNVRRAGEAAVADQGPDGEDGREGERDVEESSSHVRWDDGVPEAVTVARMKADIVLVSFRSCT
jgi:hypothetical protein